MSWKYPLTLVPPWCLLPLPDHNDGVGGCWSLAYNLVHQYADCIGCMYRGDAMSGPLDPKQMAALDYTPESWAYTESTLNLLRDRQHRMMTDKGFHDEEIEKKGTPDVMAITRLALIHTEASEAIEEIRAGHDPSLTWYEGGGKPAGVPIELADIILRVMDFAGHYKIDIAAAIREKYEYTRKRPHRHGGKKV